MTKSRIPSCFAVLLLFLFLPTAAPAAAQGLPDFDTLSRLPCFPAPSDDDESWSVKKCREALQTEDIDQRGLLLTALLSGFTLPPIEGLPDTFLEELREGNALKVDAILAIRAAQRPTPISVDRLRKFASQARQSNDSATEAFLLRSLSDTIRARSDTEELEGIAQRLRAIHSETRYPMPLLTALRVEGVLAKARSDTVTALAKERERMAILEEYGRSLLVVSAYISIGNIIYDLGDYEAALEQYQFARDGLERAGRTENLNYPTVLNNIANSLTDLGRHEEAIPIYDKALAQFQLLGDARRSAFVLFWKAKSTHALGDHDEAIRLTQQSIALGEGQLGGMQAAVVQVTLAQWLADEGRPGAAQSALDDAADAAGIAGYQDLEGLLQTKDRYWLSQYARTMSDVLYQLGRENEASRYARFALRLQTDWLEAEKVQASVNMETLLDIERRDQDILLLEKDRALQESELQQQRLFSLAGIIGTISLALLAGLAVFGWRTQRRARALQQLIVAEEHHRTKNALQLASSLVRAEARKQGEPLVPSEVEQRIKTMSLVYDRLHRSSESSGVDAAPFIEKLSEDIVDAFQGGETIKLETQIKVDKLHSTIVTPVGLILCEALINACKHAFEDRPGTICVRLDQSGRHLSLTIADDGEGSADRPPEDGGGTQLIRDLAGQLGATARVDYSNGTTWSIAPIPMRL